MTQQTLLLTLVALIAISGLVTSKTTIVSPGEQPYYMLSGGTIDLECHYTDSDAVDITLAWYKDGVEIKDDDKNGFYFTNKIDDAIRVGNLIKKNATLEDSSSYNCRKARGDDSKGWDMQLYIFNIQPTKDILAAPGDEDLELRCQIEGEVYGGYKPMKWYDGETEIVSDGAKYMTNDYNDTLTITTIEKSDIHDYVCGFVHSNGQSFNTTVPVETEPHVKHFDKSKNLVQGDPLTLVCEVWGIPVPSVLWLKGGEAIEDDGRVSYEDHEDVVNATLRIKDLDFPDRDDYTCVAENVHGMHNSTILVRVKDKLAALWPFLGICVEVAVLCLIIFIYEKRRAKKMEEEEAQEEAGHLTNSNDHKGKDDIRHRK